MSCYVLQVIKLASLRGGIVSELTAAAQPTAALPSEALQCPGLFKPSCTSGSVVYLGLLHGMDDYPFLSHSVTINHAFVKRLFCNIAAHSEPT